MSAHPVVGALLSRRHDVDRVRWHSFWEDLAAGRLRSGEAVAVLSSLATCPPSPRTTAEFLASLLERRAPTEVSFPDAVNIAGTGGGPPTFNISTAAAFVAAAAGARVVKTGARARTSAHGSYDLLDHLGVRRTKSYADTAAALQRFGLAFTGDFVYPAELRRLARAVLPVDPRSVSAFLNLLGPLLAVIPVRAQLTGVSEHRALPLLRFAAPLTGRRIWLCRNDFGSDELLGFGCDVIDRCDGTQPVPLTELPAGPCQWVPQRDSSLAELRPVPTDELVEHFLDVLAGRGGAQASSTVCLNAAALLVLADSATSWPQALAHCHRALNSGAAVDLAQRMRTRVGAGG
ncbi:hypothetical protein [Saccharopolyspora sp. 5N708]|uniref:hypothetical protein n=1 Tax=Saccharopolyspora sp. 5N708 TaxID=3457424 RepID=UPI003FD44714